MLKCSYLKIHVNVEVFIRKSDGAYISIVYTHFKCLYLHCIHTLWCQQRGRWAPAQRVLRYHITQKFWHVLNCFYIYIHTYIVYIHLDIINEGVSSSATLEGSDELKIHARFKVFVDIYVHIYIHCINTPWHQQWGRRAPDLCFICMVTPPNIVYCVSQNIFYQYIYI